MQNQPAIVISGSFRKHYKEIQAIRQQLVRAGFRILSPSSGKIRDPLAEFAVLTTDDTDEPDELERRHLDSIRRADALYVVNPDGYVGSSAGMEMGWAAGIGKPVFTAYPLAETALNAIKSQVLSPAGLVRFVRIKSNVSSTETYQTLMAGTPTEAKLKEYELCTSDANHLEGVIWTTAGILITGSVAGIGLLAGTLPPNPGTYDLGFRILVALLFLFLIWFWRRITARWYSIQIVMYERAMEIEEELGLYKERYVHWLKEAARNNALPEDAKRKSIVKRLSKNHVSTSVRKTVRWLTICLMLVWTVFLTAHAIELLPTEPLPESIPPLKIPR